MRSVGEASVNSPSSYTVLIVESASANRELYQRCLLADPTCRYTFLEADSATTAISLCQTNPIDGILTDYALPDATGSEFVQELQIRLEGSHPPVVMVTGEDHLAISTQMAVQRAVHAMKLGTKDFLIKQTLTPEQLQVAMRSAIENAQLRMQLQQQEERFRISIENMLDCFAICSTIRDEQGQIRDFCIDYLNAAALESNQLTAADLGKGLCELFPAHRETGLFDEYCQVVETGTPMTKEELTYSDGFGTQQLTRAYDIRVNKLQDGLVIAWREVTDRKRLEIELNQKLTDLQQQQHRLQRLIDTAPIGIGIGTARGEVKVANDEMLRLHDYTREAFEQQGMNWRDFSPPEFSEPTEQAMEQLRQEGFLPPGEKELVRRDGSRLPIWVSAVQWLDGSDEHVAFAIDLTRQKQAEAAIQQLNRELNDRLTELQTLIDITPVGIAIAADPSCQQMQSNAYMRQMLGVRLDCNISKSAPADEQPAFQVFQNGQEVSAEDLPMQRAAQLGIEVQDAEIEIRLPDGTIRRLLSYATPLRGEQNEIRGVVGAFLDITERKQIEAKLRRREELLNLFVKYAPAGVAMFDREMRYLAASDRWLTSYGIQDQTIIGRSHYDIFPEVPDRWKEIHQRCLAGAVEACEEDPFPRADGSIDWVRWEIHPWHTNTDEVGGIIVFSEVITERKQAEAQLREREATIRQQLAELESIYATAPVGLCFQDNDLRYVRINDRLAEINGVSAADHIGRTIPEVLPDLADTLEALHRQVIDSGEPILGIEIHGTTQAQPGVEQDWIASYYPLQELDGRVLGINVVVQDITELKQAEAALRESQAQFEAFMRHCPMTAYIKDEEGRYLYSNPLNEQLCNRPLSEWLGKTDFELFPFEEAQQWRNHDRTVLETNQSVELTETYQQDGSEFTFLSFKFPIQLSAERRLLGGLSLDITDRKRLEAEREQLLAEAQTARIEAETANQSKDEFVSVVAHELRSPLNAILGWAKLLQTRQLDAATTSKALDTIVRNTQIQVQLVEDLLDVSRMVRGTLQLEFSSVNLMNVVEAAIETVHPAAEAKVLRLETQIYPVASIWGDSSRLQQVVVNLLTNAIKFTPEGGRVQVLLEQHDSQVRLQVSDTGKGITPEFLPHIFERFQQDQQNSTAKQGLGLGLALVKYIVGQHRGTVAAQSQGEGQGATFIVRFPFT